MLKRKNRHICRVAILLTIFTFSFISLRIYAKDTRETVTINVNPDITINDYFYGFGAETLPWLWTKENKERGVNEADIRLNLGRIKGMHLAITRIFVPWETWNPSADYKTFTWKSDEMQSLYKILDFYQETGTRVILVTVDWMKDSPWKDAEASAKAILRLLEYLVKEKGYSCIQFWTLTNEPELTYGWLKKASFENYIQVSRLVKKELEKRRLAVRIIVSDEVESLQWFKNSAQSLSGVSDVFSSHLYLYPEEINLIPGFFRERLSIIKEASMPNKRPAPFFLSEFGFRGSDFGARTNNLMEDYEYGLYVADLCVEALNSGVAAASLWCLHQICLIDEINPEGGKMMGIGLWAYKDRNWQPFPIFYLYRLFTKYIRPGSKVLEVNINGPDILKVACVEYKGRYSLFIVNMNKKPKLFIVKGLPNGLRMKEYIYAESELPPDTKPEDKRDTGVEIKNYLEHEIPPSSVILFTSLSDEPL